MKFLNDVSLTAGLEDKDGDLGTSGQVLSSMGVSVNWISLGSLAALSSVNNGNWSGTDLSVANGGTGASSASAARTNLGVVNDTGTPAMLSDGSSPTLNSGISAAEVRSLIGAGSSSTTGTVTSVSGTGTRNGLTLTGTVTGSGSLTLGGDLSIGDAQWGGADLAVANGGTGSSTAAGARSNLGVVNNVVQTTITGNAGSATVLQTARTIAGVSFNGSANISLNNNAITNGAGYTTNVGDITGVTAGSGISGGGTSGTVTVTNSDKGSSQNIFKNVASDSGTAVADNNNDTLSIVGAGSVTTAVVGDILTITGSDDNDNFYVTGASYSSGTLTLTRNGLSSLTATGFPTNNNQLTNGAGYITAASLQGVPAILSNGTAPSLNTGISAAEVRSLIGAGTSSTSGTVTSVGYSHAGNAFTVGGQPVTTSGTIAVTMAGAASQYINGAGNLTTFPTIPQGDITGVTAGTGLTGGGTSGAVTVSVDYAGTNNIILEAQDLSGTQMEDGFKILFSDTGNDVSFGNVTDLPFGSSNLVIGTTSTTAKAGNITTITTGQASAITANTAKVGITTTQASNITTNNAKVGITSTQASNITTNNAKVSDTGTPAVLSNGSAPSLNTNISAAEMRSLIGAGTSSTTGTVTSIGAAFGNGNSIGTSNSPVTTSGSINFEFLGDADQYINGEGEVTTFPTIPQGDITSVVAGTGMTGGGTSGAVTLNVIGSTGITANANNIAIDATVATLAGTQTFTNKSGSNLQWTNDAGYITSAGDITGVTAGAGLSGGGTTGTVTVNVDYAGEDNIVLTAADAAGTAIALEENIMFSDGSNNVKFAQVQDLPFTSNVGDITGVTAGTNLSGGGTSGTVTINMATGGAGAGAYGSTANGTKIDTITIDAYGRITAVATGATGTSNLAIGTTASTAKAGDTTTISSAQATAITNNTAKVGITSTQASNITTNNAKVGITTTQASNITTNNAKTGITSSQATAITNNTAKTGITSGQASAITANTAKVSMVIGTTAATAKAGNTTTISSSQATAITNNTAKTGITSGQASAITANTAKTGITSSQASAITANTAKTGITSSQASAITANTAKTGITSGQASAITANTAKVGITSTQASNITTNNAKTGITSTQASNITTNNAKTGITSAQASAITANTAKVTDTGTPAILSNGSTPTLNSGISAAEVRTLIGAGTGSGTSNLVIGTTSTTAMAGDTTTITSTQAGNISTNNGKVSDTGTPAILSDGSVPTLNTNISAAEVRSLIGAGTGNSNLAIGTTASTAKAGNTTTITSTQAANIVTNNAKVSNVTQTTVSGNAGSATVLQSARTIAGVSFNGSANISLNNNAIANGAGYTSNTGDITEVSAGAGITGGGTSGSVTVNVDYAGTDNYVLGAFDDLGTQIDTESQINYSDPQNNVKRGNVSDLPFTNVSNNNQLTNGAGYITASSLPTIYTPDIWQVDDVSNCNSNRLLVFDTVNIVNGTTGTNGSAATAGMVRIASAGTYEITYSVNIKARSGISTRQAVVCNINADGTKVPGSSNTTYLRLAGSNQGGFTAMFNTSYVTVDANTDIALRIFWLDGNTKSLDIYQANGIQNTVSIRRIT
jgi:hypothetical protein